MSKKAKLALETLRKHTESSEGTENLFKPFGCLENIIDNNVLHKQNQVTLP